MNDLVKNVNGQLLTTSKIIADVFSKEHRKLMRDIKNLCCSDEFRAANFGRSSYKSLQNKELDCLNITRDGMCFLVMGFTGRKAAEWKEKYINAFNEMENGLLNIDSRMSALSIEGKDIKQIGREWSELGREVNKRKKIHTSKVCSLINDVQCKLDL